MRKLSLTAIAEPNVVGIENAGSVTSKKYLLFIRRKRYSREPGGTHKLGTAILFGGPHLNLASFILFNLTLSSWLADAVVNHKAFRGTPHNFICTA
jgi:hypothetical protein